MPSITKKGQGDWSVGDIAYFFENGMMPEGANADDSMAHMICIISQLGNDDREVITAYIKSLMPLRGPVRRPGKWKAK